MQVQIDGQEFEAAHILSALAGTLGLTGEAMKGLTAEGAGGINYDQMGLVKQDIELEAHNTLWGLNALPFIQMCPSRSVDSQTPQFAVITGYGQQNAPIFVGESGRAAQTKLRTKNITSRVVTVGLLNNVSGMAQAQAIIKVLGGRRALESNREAAHLLLALAKSYQSWFADSTATTSTFRWKGILELWREAQASASKFPNEPWNMDPAAFIDNRGKKLGRSLSADIITEMAENAWGTANVLLTDHTVRHNFQGELEGLNIERTPLVQQTAGGLVIGNPIAGIKAANAVAGLVSDNSLSPQFYFGEAAYEDGVTPPDGAPAKPVGALGVPAAAPNALSRWEAADIPASPAIKYKIQPVNDEGMGYASDATAAVSVAADDSVTLEITTDPSWKSVRILRNRADAPNKFWAIAELKNDADTLTYVDHNQFIPGGRWAFFFEMLKPRTREVIAPAGAGEMGNAVRMAELEAMFVQQLFRQGDYTEEQILHRCCPELVHSARLRVVYNILDR